MTLDLAKLKALEAKATPGEWFAWSPVGRNPDGHMVSMNAVHTEAAPRLCHECGERKHEPGPNADDALVVALRNAAPALIAAAEENKRLREALEFYAMGFIANHTPEGVFTTGPAVDDGGERARAALEKDA